MAGLFGVVLSPFAAPIGLVDFENFNNSLIYTNSVHNGPATGLMSGPAGTMSPFNAPPGSYVFMVFAAPTSQTTVDASLSGWAAEAYGVNTATPGLMNGNITTDPGALLTTYGSGETANFLVVGWSANIGDNWGQVSTWWNNGNPSGPSGWFGISDIAQDVVVGGGPYPVPTIFGPTVGYEIQGFTLNLYNLPPNVSDTGCATTLSGTGATLNGTANPNRTAASAWFQWGTSAAYGNTSPIVNLGSGVTNIAVSTVLTGLTPGVSYHYRLVTTNTVGTTYGSDCAFSTPPGTLTVTSLADSGPGTLRDLVSAASCDQVITFAPGLAGTITLTGPLPIVRNVVIAGPGASTLTISGNNSTPVLSVGATASVSGVTISGGFEGGGYPSGAGIRNGGNLTLSNCVVTGNSEQGWSLGGAIFNCGTLRLVGCTFSGNTAIGPVGGNGVNASSGVQAGDGYPGHEARGGAIYNTGPLTALNCSFSGNIAQGGNGGNGGNGGTYGAGGKGGNGGNGLGGAIETSGSCTLINCTIDGNTVTLGTGGTGGSQVGPPTQAPNGTNGISLGGGIHISSGGSVTLLNTIAAQDTGASPDTSGSFTSQGHNLIGATNGSSGWLASDLTGSTNTTIINARLGALQDNGGPTPTMALAQNSPALDAGDGTVMNSPTSLTVDQRGWPRKLGAQVDIGAFEALPPLPSPSPAGTALSFDGAATYLSIGAASVPTPWTAEFWVNRLDAPSYSASLLGDGSTALKLEQFNYTRKVGFTRFGVADYTFNYSAPTGTWVHLAFVADTQTRLYVNGVLQDSNPNTINLPLGRLGYDSSGDADYMRGTLDEVRLWKVARSQAQIQANMNRTLSVPQSNLIAYWRFDEGTGLTTGDSSGTGKTGTLVNSPLWVTSTAPFSPNLFPTPSGSNIIISWASPPAGFALQESSDLLNWTAVTLPVLDDHVAKTVIVPTSQSKKFYRLEKQ